jgi:tetratricopeptide (TPR) repeat protein
LALDPELAQAHGVLGFLAMALDQDLEVAARSYERALSLNPRDPILLRQAATVVQSLGRIEFAMELTLRSVEMDPVNPAGHQNLGSLYRLAGRFDDSVASFRTALTLSPDMLGARSNMALALMEGGKPEEGLEEAGREPDEGYRLIAEAILHHALGHTEESDATLSELIEKYEHDAAFNIAYVYAYRGETEKAFAWLDKAIEYGDFGLAEAPYESMLASLHDDPRWPRFLEEIGMAPEQLASIKFDVQLPE